jgi:hypothetical protein
LNNYKELSGDAENNLIRLQRCFRWRVTSVTVSRA